MAMVAGEASGDLLASLLLRGLRQQGLECNAAGVGGPHMVAEQFDAWFPSSQLSVRGYVEVLKHYRSLVRLRKNLGDTWLGDRPDVFVGVDAPDFNLALAKRLRERHIKCVQFVCPSIWAWRPERVALIREAVDHVLCIFPFEVELLARHGISATYVGHPIAQMLPMEPDRLAARLHLGVAAHGEPLVALLPGSRSSEIEHLLPRFLAAAQYMLQAKPDLQFVLPAVPTLTDRINQLIAMHGAALPLKVVEGQSHACMAAADVVLVASGTATLEVAMSKRPMVIAYHMARLSWWIHQSKRLQPWVGLPNILAERFLVPELLQDQATPENLAKETLAWFDSPERVRALVAEFGEMHQQLNADTAAISARAIHGVLRG